MARARKKAPNGEQKKSRTLSIRLREDLCADLEKSADKNATSLNHEISVRLQASLSEERAFGGPALTKIAHVMASRFVLHGHQAGETMFGPDVTEDQWLDNPYCFDNGLLAVIDALWARRPDRTEESDDEMFQRLAGRIKARWLNERAKQ